MSTLAPEVRGHLLSAFQAICADAQIAKDKRDKASKSAGTSYMDAVKKSTDTEVKDIQAELDSLYKRSSELRESQKARLVEIGEMSAQAASVDKLREEASKGRQVVRLQHDALVKSGLITDEAELAQIETWSRPVLGQERGRAASADSSDAADNADGSDEDTTSDEPTEENTAPTA